MSDTRLEDILIGGSLSRWRETDKYLSIDIVFKCGCIFVFNRNPDGSVDGEPGFITTHGCEHETNPATRPQIRRTNVFELKDGTN